MLPRGSAGVPAEETFWSFVHELACSPEAPDLLSRLKDGHEPDEHGWCRHQAHTHHWEQYPCFTRRLADLACKEREEKRH